MNIIKSILPRCLLSNYRNDSTIATTQQYSTQIHRRDSLVVESRQCIFRSFMKPLFLSQNSTQQYSTPCSSCDSLVHSTPRFWLFYCCNTTVITVVKLYLTKSTKFAVVNKILLSFLLKFEIKNDIFQTIQGSGNYNSTKILLLIGLQ